jgi:AefR-like transcriptional repressor, C-terminal domain
MQLLSLLESELLQRVLLGVVSSVRPEALNSAARRAIETFLSGYARG